MKLAHILASSSSLFFFFGGVEGGKEASFQDERESAYGFLLQEPSIPAFALLLP